MLLFLDVETGGYNPEEDSLLTVGLTVYDNKRDEVIECKEFFVQHDKYVVNYTALNTNKIDIVKHHEMAKSKETVVDEIIKFIKLHFGDEKPTIAGQNVSFDNKFLFNLFKKCDKNWYEYVSHKTVDTMHMLRGLYYMGILEEDITALDRAIKYFDIDVIGRHTALGDNYATIEVYCKIRDLLCKY